MYIKLYYIIFSFLTLFSVFYFFSEHILFLIAYETKDILVLKNPQDFTNLLLDISFFFSFYIILYIIPIIAYIYFINIFPKQINLCLIFLLNIYYYYLAISFMILNWDLSSSSWDIFSNWKEMFFDFQPSLEYIFYSYKVEYIDLLIYTFIIYIYIISSLFFGVSIWNYKYIHKILLLIAILMHIYFFGGDSLVTDFIIIGISIFFFELNVFICIFFSQIKKYKT